MKLHGRIPVEPLDEERLTNIERRLVVGVSELAMKPARASWRKPFAFAGIALAVAAAAVIGWQLHQPAAVAPTIAQAEHFKVDTQGEHSTLVLDDATIASAPATAFEVTHGDGRVVIQMARGKLDLAVQHRPGRVLVIHAGDTEIEDIGTKFSVDYDGKSSVDVRVTEGEVKISRKQLEVRVAAGKAWTSDRGLVALTDLDVKPEPVQVPEPKPVVVATAPAHDVGLREHVAIAPPTPQPKPAHTAHVDAHPIVVPQSHDAAIAAADPYVELRTAIRRQPIAFDPKIDGKADAAAEIAKLKKIAYSSATVGPEASQALYQMAVLLHRPLGQDTEALHTLDMYRRRFTGGKEMTAVLWLRVRIVCGRGIDEECRRAAYTYQHEVTTGEATGVAIRITNAP